MTERSVGPMLHRMGDEQSTTRINQKFLELLNEFVTANPMGDPREVVKVAYETLVQWGQSVRINVSGMTDEYFNHLAQQVWATQVRVNVNKMLHELLARNVSPTGPNMAPLPVREAVKKTIDQLTDWMRSMNYPVNGFGFDTEEEFEKLVVQAEKMLETYRVNQEKGATPLGQHGIYIKPLSDDEYNERMKRVGLA